MRMCKYSKRMFLFLAFSSIFFVVTLVFGLLSNKAINKITDERDNRLLYQEHLREEVIKNIYMYLSVNESNYNFIKDEIKIEPYLKSQEFGVNFKRSNFIPQVKVNIVDCQYTLETEDKIVFYVLAKLDYSSGAKYLNFLVFVRDGLVYNIIVY